MALCRSLFVYLPGGPGAEAGAGMEAKAQAKAEVGARETAM